MNIKRKIFRELVIILGLGVAVYLFLLVMPRINFPLPKYKFELTNGEAYTINISPELSQGRSVNYFIDSTFNPSQSLISKRVGEFIKDNNIKSEVKNVYQINSREMNISKFFYSFFKLNFIIKVFMVYAFLLIVRFIFWALRVLRLWTVDVFVCKSSH